MKAVKVDKTKLLDILKTNKDNHRAMFLEAQEGYRNHVIKELDKRLIDAKNGKRIDACVTFIAPIDQTKEYDRAIGMLEMSLDDSIEISQQEYSCYVLDEWTWSRMTLHSNSNYSDRAATEFTSKYAEE